MADIELVIKIPEELYKKIKENGYTYKELPKGHGRLIDADELKKEYPHDMDWEYPVNTNCCVVESIDNSPTIIEADTGTEDKDEYEKAMKKSILDEIEAEINTPNRGSCDYFIVDKIEEIIDKYKEESEGK